MTRSPLLSALVGALAVALASAGAGEAPTADPPLDAKAATELRNQVRALHTEASKRGDVWTALQIEGWSRQQPESLQRLLDLKLRPLLGGSIVYGDPTFAFPTPIVAWVDAGDAVLVATRTHCYRLAPDGRPIALAMPWARPAAVAAFAPGSETAGALVAGKDGDDFVFITESVVDGHPILDRTVARKEGEEANGPPVVAVDGSAMALGVARAGDGAGRLRVLIAAAHGPSAVKRLAVPRGIGPDGHWLICEDPQGRPVLLVDGKPVTGIAEDDGVEPPADGATVKADPSGKAEPPDKAKKAKKDAPPVLTDAAIGPGIALVTAAGHAALVGRDARLTMLEPPIGLGPNPRALSVGRWVVLASGPEAKTRATTDVLGNPVAGGQPQPPTLALYRWQDLAARADAAPVLVVENDEARRAPGEPAALYLWRDAQLDLLDLSGDEPEVRPLYTAPRRITGVSVATYAAVLHFEDGSRVIVDHLGRELWTGSGEYWLPHPRWLLQRVAGARTPFTFTHLDADPAQRQQLALDLPDGAWEFGYDAIADQLVGWLGGGPWATIDVRSGARIEEAQETTAEHPRPIVDPIAELPGRFHAAPGSARLLRKLVARDLAAQQWEPADAWRLQQHVLLVLERNGQLLAYGGGRKGFKLVGRCRRGDRLVGDANQPVIADDGGNPLAALAPGPALNHVLPAKMRKPEDLPAGAWRVDNGDLTFSTPKGGNLTWNTERVGFAPRRLRSPDNGGMLIVTDSLVVELDPAAAKVVGKAK